MLKKTNKIYRKPEAFPFAVNTVFSRLELCPVTTILQKAQTNDCMHLKYFKELNESYEKMDHDKFKLQFLKGLRVWMRFDEKNVYANAGLRFCGRYLTTLPNDVSLDTHPMLVSTFEFLLSMTSLVANVRFRICQFVNTILDCMSAEAALEDYICLNITAYMLDRLNDMSPVVRLEAVKALRRLQLQNDPNDAIRRSYLFHLANDPSSAVRIGVITAIERNFQTIPAILERLWDVDEKVRTHNYLEMSRYSVKAYKVVHRIILLEQGLNDESDRVRKTVMSVLLPQWLQSYGGKYMALVTALKIDANEIELKRFVRIAKQSLFVLFKNESTNKLIDQIPFISEGDKFVKCVPFEKLTVETCVFWCAIIEYSQLIPTDIKNNDNKEHLQKYVCDMSTFCEYLNEFYCLVDTIDLEQKIQWITLEGQYKAYILMDILLILDVGDETGRKTLEAFVIQLMSKRALDEEIIRKLVLKMENLIRESNERLQFFVDIVRSYTDPLEGSIDLSMESVSFILNNITDQGLKMKITQLRLAILDLREQMTIANERKDYLRVHTINDKLTAQNDELLLLINEIEPVNAQMSVATKKMTSEATLQCLQICFYAVASKHTSTLMPNMCQLYKEFVRIQIESNFMGVRNWALKCGIAYSLKYEQLAKDTYDSLTNQFYKHHNTCIWETSIKGVFELVDKYGFEFFTKGDSSEIRNEPSDDDESEPMNTAILTLLLHFLDTCKEATILKTLIIGFSRLVLSGRARSTQILSQLMLKFFDPACDSEIHQILAIFFQALITRTQQKCLVAALLPTLHSISNAPKESPLKEIKFEEVIKFVVKSTKPTDPNTAFNIHNVIGLMFLNTMMEHYQNQELMKLLSKELLTLQVSTDFSLRKEYQAKTENMLQHSLDSLVEKNIRKFQEMFAGKPKEPDSDIEIL